MFETVNISLLCQSSCFAPVLLTSLTRWVHLSSSTAAPNCPSIIHSSSLTCNIIQVTALSKVSQGPTHCLDSFHLLNSAESSKKRSQAPSQTTANPSSFKCKRLSTLHYYLLVFGPVFHHHTGQGYQVHILWKDYFQGITQKTTVIKSAKLVNSQRQMLPIAIMPW